jgi:hypothetical protein
MSAVQRSVDGISDMLELYNKAFGGLTAEGNSNGFRDFLLRTPAMLTSLGEKLGAVQHIVSYWTHRFPIGRPVIVSPLELMGFLIDFEESLTFIDANEGEERLSRVA